MVHANTLPEDVLVPIFRRVVDAQSLSFERVINEGSLPLNSLAISQVCMQWRNAALSSQGLWTHIDLCTRGEVVSLARIFASRSGDLPLSIRILAPTERRNPDGHSYDQLDDFISIFGPRAHSVEIALKMSYHVAWCRIIQQIVRHASGELTRLILSRRHIDSLQGADYTSEYRLLMPKDSTMSTTVIGPSGKAIVHHIPQELLENVLSNIRILKLDLVYPLRESKAYHGLTELRLTGPRKITAIWRIHQLASILEASPKLRVLHFGLEVGESQVKPAQVRLADLEVFLLQSLSFASQQAVLSLILPGTKPLQMSTTYEREDMFPGYFSSFGEPEELRSFFNRSNIVQLQVHSQTFINPQFLLSLLPNLQSLILCEVKLEGILTDGSTILCPRLSELHFVACTIGLYGFLWLVNGRNLREATIWKSRIIVEVGFHPAERYRDTLLEACPIVQILDPQDYKRVPKIEGWGEDMWYRIARSR
ncbi:hypothetical protein FRC11_004719, partial [Ceratobasidium sp. 423]